MMSSLPAPKTATDYQWDLVCPAAGQEAGPTLMEFSEFRGRILYAGGRRRCFRREDGTFADDDPLDWGSFHITARTDSVLAGCVRLRPLPEFSQSSFGRLVTPRQFDAALEEMHLTRNDCLEVSRWIVAPSARRTAVGPTLVVGAWAVGRWLGKRSLLATVGTRDGQVAMLGRFGGKILHSLGAKYIAEYDDELANMNFDLTCPPPRIAAKLDSVGRLLGLLE